jgi:hypothetical protein
MDAMDGQLGPEALRRLEKELQPYPDLKEEAALLGIRFDAPTNTGAAFGSKVQAAFPIKNPPEARLSRILSTLANSAVLPASYNVTDSSVFEQQVWRWFPAYATAAAVLLMGLLGMYSSIPGISSDDAIMDEATLHEWIYAADVQQAFSDDDLLVDAQTYELFLPAGEETATSASESEAPDEN